MDLIQQKLPAKAMEQEMICSLALILETFAGASGRTEISPPRLDINGYTKEAIFSLLRTCDSLSLMGNPISAPGQSCRFVKDRRTLVRWDGKVSPCMGLLHTHKTYLNGLERAVSAYSFLSHADIDSPLIQQDRKALKKVLRIDKEQLCGHYAN